MHWRDPHHGWLHWSLYHKLSVSNKYIIIIITVYYHTSTHFQLIILKNLFMLTIPDWLEEFGDTVAFGELARVAHGPGADEPEEHSERIDVDAAIILAGDEFRRHVQRRADNAAGHHRRRLAETKVSQLATIFKVQLTTISDKLDLTLNRLSAWVVS